MRRAGNEKDLPRNRVRGHIAHQNAARTVIDDPSWGVHCHQAKAIRVGLDLVARRVYDLQTPKLPHQYGKGEQHQRLEEQNSQA